MSNKLTQINPAPANLQELEDFQKAQFGDENHLEEKHVPEFQEFKEEAKQDLHSRPLLVQAPASLEQQNYIEAFINKHL